MSSFNIETILNSLPEDSTVINLDNKRISRLPSLRRFKNLKELYVNFNQLTSLPELPDTLTNLYCSCNYLTALPRLPDTLTYLGCAMNQLTSLPELPDGLDRLIVGYNKLTSLPRLPDTLKMIHCENNELTSLPVLPAQLNEMTCNRNRLTFLPELPNSIEYLYCVDNLIACLPILPASLRSFTFHNNPVAEIIYCGSFGIHFSENELMVLRKYKVNKATQTLIQFKHLYYSLRFKAQFRKWLWERIREPKAMKRYHWQYWEFIDIEQKYPNFDLNEVLKNKDTYVLERWDAYCEWNKNNPK